MYKLMIVDDNSVQIEYIRSCIDCNELNISEIFAAYDGEEGLEIYEKERPDIIITDVEMPILDGVKMMKKIFENGGKGKFIFISCYDDFEYIKQAMDNNAASYLLKPVDPAELKENILKAQAEIEKEEDYTKLNKILGESLEMFRENFLYRFLHSTHIDESYLKNTIINLGFNKYCEFYTAVFDTNGKTDIYGFLNEVKAFVLSKLNGTAVLESDSRCVAVFMNENSTDFRSVIKNVLTEFCKNMKEKYGVDVSIGLSNAENTLYNAKLMLDRASGVLDSRIMTSDTGIYEYDENANSGEFDYEIAEMRDSILYMYESKNEDPVNEFLLKYYKPSMNIDYMKKLSISVITTLQLILMERGIKIDELFGSSAVVWDKLDRFETIPDNRRWLYNILKTTLEYITDNEHYRYKKIVHDIEENINENFAYVSNVNEVIDNLYISASYAQSIFKKYTGKTISDYVTERRMEAAKELLSDPYIKVYEVAEKVGYKSKAHFTESFKKYTGVTPKEFRMTH